MLDDNRNPLLDGRPAQPLLVVLSGPSGVGKDSILMRMRDIGFPFHFVDTATSRAQRPGERDGYDYHFVSKERFEEMIARGELLEWAEVYGHYKGIPKSEVIQALQSGRDVILRIDVQVPWNDTNSNLRLDPGDNAARHFRERIALKQDVSAVGQEDVGIDAALLANKLSRDEVTLDRDPQAKVASAPAEEVRLAENIKWRYVELGAPLPNRQGKVRADPGGLAERQCQRLHKSLLQHEG